MRTVRRLIPLVFLFAPPLAAQELSLRPDTGTAAGHVRLGIGAVPLPASVRLAAPADPALRAPYGSAALAGGWARAWRTVLDTRLAAARRELWRGGMARSGADSVSSAARVAAAAPGAAETPDSPPHDSQLPGLAGDLADLGLVIDGRAELGGEWGRHRPCDPGVHLTCDPSAIPQLRPDIELGIRVGGTVSDRIHVNVDYDQRREFDGANTLNVYYRGFEDEIIQRVDFGDVSLRLPASRYLTRGVPAGNFGVKAEGQLGPVDFQALWAQQKGDLAMSEFRLGGPGSDGGLVQDLEIARDDADYVTGQFFFLVDPEALTGHPHIDVLTLSPAAAPATLRPSAGAGIEIYRDERPSFSNPEQQAQLGYFMAEAVTAGDELRHRGLFRRLLPGEDYWVHPSGLWFVLRSPLRQDEALAASYVTEAGLEVGTVGAERAPPGTMPRLLLVRGAASVHQPGQPTWRYEMHQVYRLDSSSRVDPASVEVEISLGGLAGGATFREADGRTVSFLKLFGLDEEAPPDRLDGARLFQPRRGSFGQSRDDVRVGGTFLVFPTLEPFGSPPPLPSLGWTADQAAQVLGADANRGIYEEPDPVNRGAGSRFRLNLRYRVQVDGMVSSFNLGAFGLREGSERITVDGRQLQRGVDYEIDYELGLVTLSDAAAIFGMSPNAEIRANWEQKALFQTAPTNVFGMNARYRARHGELNLIGMYQAERSLMARPQLGLEPATSFLGGVSGKFDFGAAWLDHALERVPGLRSAAASAVRIDGELALSLPNPNGGGLTYLEDFAASDHVPIGLERRFWRLGSRPQARTGADQVLPHVLDVPTAASLVWQHDFLSDGGPRGPLTPGSIDAQLSVAGTALPEPVLYLTFGDADDTSGEERWRSVTTVLSTTGRDMSRSEHVELYVAQGEELSLVFDIGAVSNDAFYFNDAGEAGGAYPDGRPWGLGVLDQEASLSAGEVWGREQDERGLWDQGCRAEPGKVYALGDPAANCTRGNGLIDTEDLDGTGVLEVNDGAYFRYVVRLDGSSPYLVRDTDATGTAFRLYRIPLRGAGAIPVNGAGDATWRFVRHLRLTVAGPARGGSRVAIARLRVVGSRWTKRDLDGVRRGLIADEPGVGTGGTRVEVGEASRITAGGDYSPPPGVADRLQDPRAAFGAAGIEFNTRSFRLGYESLEPDDRAEVYYRYPQQPRNLLGYRELRLWAVPRAGRWGGGGERLVVRVGSDARNFYLFQTELPDAVGPGGVRPEHWLPELVIGFEEWLALRAEAERILIEEVQSADGPLTVWSADSTYAIVLEDRARAPNLAAVRELGFAVYNAGGTPVTGELWLDEVRLGRPVRDAGLAGHIDLDVSGGDFFTGRLTYGSRGAFFHQLGEQAGYQTRADVGIGGTVQLGRLVPEHWAVDAPVTVSHSRSGTEPVFLEGSDIQAGRLEGLRRPGSERTRVGLSLRRTAPMENPLLGLLLDGASARVGFHSTSSTASVSAQDMRGVEAGASYHRRPAGREVPLLPGAAGRLLERVLPGPAGALGGARLRWTPDHISFGSSYRRDASRSFRYTRILPVPGDSALAPTESWRQVLDNTARIGFRPLESLHADVTLASTRDLLAPERAAAHERQREALAAARRGIGGLDLGWETSRSIQTNVGFRPVPASWLRPGLTYAARYRSDRHPSQIELLVSGDDTTAVLQHGFRAERQLSRTLLLDPAGLVAATLGTPEPGDGGAAHALGVAARRLRPIDLSWTTTLSSRYERETSAPGLGYQLGLGGSDAFRFMSGDTAASALERRAVRLRTGVRLAAGADLELGFGRSGLEIHDLRSGGRRETDTIWPELRLAWSDIPVPAGVRQAITRVSLGLGYQHSGRDGTLGSGARDRGRREHTVPFQLALGLGRSLTALYNGSRTSGSGYDPTGRTGHVAAQHGFQLTGAVLAPAAWRASLPQPIQASVRYDQRSQRHCRLRQTAGETCTPYVDAINRNLDLMLETAVSELDLGAQMSYIDRRSRIGTHPGHTSFQLTIFARFRVSAGVPLGGLR